MNNLYFILIYVDYICAYSSPLIPQALPPEQFYFGRSFYSQFVLFFSQFIQTSYIMHNYLHHLLQAAFGPPPQICAIFNPLLFRTKRPSTD